MAASCSRGEKYEKTMTDAAVATADRVCGVYRLVEMEWTGAPVDLDGDGIARSLWEECLSGKNNGAGIPETGEIDMIVTPIRYGYTGTIDFVIPMFMGDFPAGEYRGVYSLRQIPALYQIDSDGSIVFDAPKSYYESATTDATFGFRNISISWEENGDFLASATTSFYDLLSKQQVEGCETLRFHCISTKERKK